MKHIYNFTNRFKRGAAFILLSPLYSYAQPLEIQAEFDTTLDFWASYTANWETSDQGYVSNTVWGPSASQQQYTTVYDYIMHFVRFDLSGISESMVDDPNFRAELDVMAHGFSRDKPNEQLIDLLSETATPYQQSFWGDGKIYLTVHRITDNYFNTANRWMKRPVSGSFLDWEDDAEIPPVENITQFSENDFEREPIDTVIYRTGWSSTNPDVGTKANEFGEMVWNVTDVVRAWVKGEYDNNGFALWADPDRSMGEQLNVLTMETPPGDRGFPTGGAAPILRVEIVDPSALWANLRIDESNTVDTAEWLGELLLIGDDWVYSHELERPLSIPESGVSEQGGWVYFPR